MLWSLSSLRQHRQIFFVKCRSVVCVINMFIHNCCAKVAENQSVVINLRKQRQLLSWRAAEKPVCGLSVCSKLMSICTCCCAAEQRHSNWERNWLPEYHGEHLPCHDWESVCTLLLFLATSYCTTTCRLCRPVYWFIVVLCVCCTSGPTFLKRLGKSLGKFLILVKS